MEGRQQGKIITGILNILQKNDMVEGVGKGRFPIRLLKDKGGRGAADGKNTALEGGWGQWRLR